VQDAVGRIVRFVDRRIFIGCNSLILTDPAMIEMPSQEAEYA
jgi:hypothetical protein